jgi:hypothetical protein
MLLRCICTCDAQTAAPSDDSGIPLEMYSMGPTMDDRDQQQFHDFQTSNWWRASEAAWRIRLADKHYKEFLQVAKSNSLSLSSLFERQALETPPPIAIDGESCDLHSKHQETLKKIHDEQLRRLKLSYETVETEIQALHKQEQQQLAKSLIDFSYESSDNSDRCLNWSAGVIGSKSGGGSSIK